MREISEILPHRHGKPPPLVKNIGPLIRAMAKKVFLSCFCRVHVHLCRQCACGSVFIHVWAAVRACAAHTRRQVFKYTCVHRFAVRCGLSSRAASSCVLGRFKCA